MEIRNKATGGITINFEKKVEYEKDSKKIKKDPLLEIKPTSLKEFKFIFEGEIDEENIKENKKIVADFLNTHTGSYRVILDFEKLYYCNSTFIGQIADWYNKIKKRNGEIIISNPNKDILDIIDMVGLTKVIPIKQTNK
jgi:anti-anti-sigma factor